MVPTIESGLCTTAINGGQEQDYLQHISPYYICVLAYNEEKVTFCKHVSNLSELGTKQSIIAMIIVCDFIPCNHFMY